MAESQGTTFSVIVIAFPSGGDDVVRALSEAFGIGAEEAAAIVARAPVRVKKGVDGAAAKQLASLLLGVGAELAIRNEITGEEKTYSPGDRRRSSGPRVTPAPVISESHSASSPPVRADASMSLMEALRVARERSESGASIRPLGRTSSSPSLPPAIPAPARISAPPIIHEPSQPPEPPPHEAAAPLLFTNVPLDAPLDAPPPEPPPEPPAPAHESAPPPPELPQMPESKPSVPLVKCASCGRFTDKDAKCIHCGWSHEEKKHYCRSCGKPVPLTSGLPGVTWTALAAGGLALGGVGFWLLGPFAGLAGPLFAFGAGAALAGSRLRYRCQACRRDVEASWQQPIEKATLARARVRNMAGGAVAAVIALGLLVPSSGRATPLYIDSFGTVYSATVPRANAEPLRKGLTVSTDYGASQLIVLSSSSPRQALHTYALLELALPRDSQPNLDDAGLERVLGQAVEGLVRGAKLDKAEPVNLGGAPGRVMSFQGRLDGQPVFGRARGFRFSTHELAIAVVLASSAEAAASAGADDFLRSLAAGQAKPR